MPLISWISSRMLVTSGPARSTAVPTGWERSTARASASPRSSTHTGWKGWSPLPTSGMTGRVRTIFSSSDTTSSPGP
jgi:hypothetical protein